MSDECSPYESSLNGFGFPIFPLFLFWEQGLGEVTLVFVHLILSTEETWSISRGLREMHERKYPVFFLKSQYKSLILVLEEILNELRSFIYNFRTYSHIYFLVLILGKYLLRKEKLKLVTLMWCLLRPVQRLASI